MNPHGIEIAGNPQTLMGRVFRSNRSSRGRRRSGFCFSSAIVGAAIGVVGRDQHIHIRKDRRDVAARPFQFAAAFEQGLRADILAGANSAQRFRLVKFRAASDELGVKSVRLGALQGSVGRHRQLDVADFSAQRSQS